jgi:plastocyanin
MKAQHIMMVGSALLILTGCQSMGGGGSAIPTVTRTGMVKDIVIREDVSPTTVTVNPGDEIRWINKRTGAARVVFLDPVMEQLSCQRNFGGLMGADRNQFTASLGSNDSASLCFRHPGEVKYVVRADSTNPSGEVNIPGSITVGGNNDRSSTRDTSSSPTNEMAGSRSEQDRMSTR